MKDSQTNQIDSQPPASRGTVIAQRQSQLTWQFLGVALAAGVLCLLVLPVDDSISSFFRGWDAPGDLQKAVQLSEAFAHGAGVSFILLTVFVVALDRRRAVLVAILITSLSGVIANAFKATIIRVRPYAVGLQVHDHAVLDQANQGNGNQGNGLTTAHAAKVVASKFWDTRQRSFPSGHAATAWGLAIGLSLVFRRAWWVMVLLATLASFQRLESGAHFLSDILAGTAIAFVVAACIVAIPQIRRELQTNAPVME